MTKTRPASSQAIEFDDDEITIEPDWTAVPGKSLKESLNADGLSAEQASEAAGIPYPVFLGILTGAVPITVDLAQALTKITRVSAKFWLSYEADYQADLKRLGLQRPVCLEAEAYHASLKR